MVMEVVHEDMGEDSMQCTNHPYKNSTPGGICAFCLQEKLGKLVSSSYPVPVFPSSSSSSSPSFRSTYAAAAAATSSAVLGGGSTALQNGVSDSYSSHTRRSKLPFVLTHRKKKKKESSSSTSDSTAIVFKRSKSTATPRRGGGNNNNIHLLDEEDYNSPSRRGFWSFLHLPNRPKKLHHHHHHLKDSNFTPTTPATVCNNENGSPDDKFSDRKVSRSRSVGCGSRSFSGDFFERISTGFGDCTLRRVESQREGKPKNGGKNGGGGGGMNGQDYIKERVKCGGLFSGFMIAGSSSSSSSSSSYWVAGNSVEENSKSQMVNLSHGRSKNWGWAFASPMRAFSKNININNNSGKRDADLNSNKNRSPNLSAIPSLLAVSG
ncbi:hypothetical protein ABFS82_14G008200 [Erythranthe guttata]|uniref:Uncharacterized protein n=1 Tax=Erythranthe guttata TaxID=4155 RepID=A0A022RZX4_ERYGU|nr:PREDICTED: uncharacterized protein LOC105962142 [Erythranthe guttata]EYU45546.1 hypothetical protein MIMGU_mgv1a022941mg [Erythranthe guttata]|eukprot:XP_012841880.1 PREDICTED: uncharacterized protein LOC105962142 [Erythranthe guttata]